MVAKLIYASSDKSSEMLFATNFIASDPFIYFEADHKKGIIVSPLEHARAINEVKEGVEVFETTDIDQLFQDNHSKNISAKTAINPTWGDKSRKKHLSSKEIMVALNDIFQNNTWNIPHDFPYSIGEYLHDKKMDIKSIDGLLFPERQIKTKKEINALKNALKIAENAMQAALDILQRSTINNDKTLSIDGEILTSEKIKLAIGIEILKGGGVAEHTIVSCGKDSSEPHNSGSGPLYANQPIVIDIFPRIMEPITTSLPAGYWGDITRTFVKGKASQTVKNAYRVVKLAREESESCIKEGMIPSDIHKLALKVLTDSGFKTEKINNINRGFFHGLGHGVGLDIHEQPSLSLKNNTPLKANEIVTIEPGLYYPEWGGVRLENMITIGKEKSNVLTTFPNELEIE